MNGVGDEIVFEMQFYSTFHIAEQAVDFFEMQIRGLELVFMVFRVFSIPETVVDGEKGDGVDGVAAKRGVDETAFDGGKNSAISHEVVDGGYPSLKHG